MVHLVDETARRIRIIPTGAEHEWIVQIYLRRIPKTEKMLRDLAPRNRALHGGPGRTGQRLLLVQARRVTRSHYTDPGRCLTAGHRSRWRNCSYSETGPQQNRDLGRSPNTCLAAGCSCCLVRRSASNPEGGRLTRGGSRLASDRRPEPAVVYAQQAASYSRPVLGRRTPASILHEDCRYPLDGVRDRLPPFGSRHW